MNRRARIAPHTPWLVSGALRRAAMDLHPTAALPPIPTSFVEPRFARDFSQVQTHGGGSLEGPAGIFINGPGSGSAEGPSSPPPVPKPQAPPPAKAAGNCPTDIRVAEVDQGNDRNFGKDGRITGWGGYAVMEVSDPSGKSWDGTAIHENLTNVQNSCGDDGKGACSNQSGDNGAGGSTFEVGRKSNFREVSLAAAKNRFYDLHIFKQRGSLLHALGKEKCEAQCEQFYDCGGKRFGPTFVITYTMTKDLVTRADGLSNAVTRVRVSKAAKTAAPTAPSGSAKP